MPRYEVVLFDADHTLFDFDRAEREALRQTLEEAGLPADGETEARYLSINRALWNRLDRGEVRREWLVVERFAALLRALGRTGDAAALNRAYLDHLGRAYLLPGAQALCRALAPAAPWPLSPTAWPAPSAAASRHPPERPHPLAVYFGGAGGQQARLRLFAPVLRTLGNPDPAGC
ncbi:noncanonical pyrimidine nucleotidase, YjjG family [Flavonifractor plautii]|nr:noncanonical pyrimidine nucleotidase, YjjG family [Flavonifractor plautii]